MNNKVEIFISFFISISLVFIVLFGFSKLDKRYKIIDWLVERDSTFLATRKQFCNKMLNLSKSSTDSILVLQYKDCGIHLVEEL